MYLFRLYPPPKFNGRILFAPQYARAIFLNNDNKKKGQLKIGYCRPNAVPLRLRRNHNYYYYLPCNGMCSVTRGGA